MDGPDRAAVVRRLVALEGEGRLGSEQVQLAAGGLKVSERTVCPWLRPPECRVYCRCTQAHLRLVSCLGRLAA